MRQHSDNKEEILKEQYLQEARRFTEALMNNPSPQELTNIRRNVKEILKEMLRQRNNRSF